MPRSFEFFWRKQQEICSAANDGLREEEKMSSIYRELRNLGDFVHKAADNGLLEGAQLVLFTDNLVADYAFHKGS